MDSKGLPYPATQGGLKERRGRGVCCCISLWLCSVLTTLIVSLGITLLVFYIVIHPQLPKYDVQNFQLTRFPNRTLSTADPDPNTILSFQLVNRNPNKKADIYYDESYVNVMDEVKDISVGTTSIPAYSQSEKTTTTLEPDFHLQKETSNTLRSADHDLSDWPVLVKVDVKARLKVRSFKSKELKVKARCHLRVNVVSSTPIITYKSCKVDT